ncbi:MAG TPA: argininosuccinate lyase, partial [Anaerovoracaceae bacterium]|nr:argininosuccinate lyase [Anaerovoracaceae bacterium]
MKLWKGRFLKAENSLAEEFNASIEVDQRLYKQDITGSIAHAKMLAKQGIISEDEALAIESSLLEILSEIEQGKIRFTIEQEDIHMNIESILTERLGPAGKKLHTARSRNDQVAVDIRLYLKDEIKDIIGLVKELNSTLTSIARENQNTVMPGYTHLQRAQPITLAFHLMAYREMFRRDIRRFENCYEGTDSLPLGSGALAGTTYNTDRDYLAEKLGFAKVCQNAMDAVSDR